MDDLYKALPRLMRAAGESEELTEAAAKAVWRRVAGEGLRTCAVPFRLYRKTLVIAVPDVTWQRQLDAMRWNLLNRLNSFFEQTLITNIEFRVDPHTVRAERERLRVPVTADEKHRQQALNSARDLQPAAEAIHDEDLRHKFLLAAGSCIRRTNQ